MQNEPLTPRDLYEMVDYYRGMRMNLDRDGGDNVWRYKHARNIIHHDVQNLNTITCWNPGVSTPGGRQHVLLGTL